MFMSTQLKYSKVNKFKLQSLSHLEWPIHKYLKKQSGKTMYKFLNTVCSTEIEQEMFNITYVTVGTKTTIPRANSHVDSDKIM